MYNYPKELHFDNLREYNKKFPSGIYICIFCKSLTNNPYFCKNCKQTSNTIFDDLGTIKYSIGDSDVRQIFPPIELLQ